MDKLTHTSLVNCIKELDSLEKLILTEKFSYTEIADWIAQVSWELSNVFRSKVYDSDEFQFQLRKIIKNTGGDGGMFKAEENSGEEMFNGLDNYQCGYCDIWIQNTGDWYCDECGANTCERCGKQDEEDGFLCPECFSIPPEK